MADSNALLAQPGWCALFRPHQVLQVSVFWHAWQQEAGSEPMGFVPPWV
jgi:hypothetical protein